MCSKNLGGCKCCCQDKIMVGENYILVDSASSSHVGPTMHILPYCGCASEKGKNVEKHKGESQIEEKLSVSHSLFGDKNNIAPAAHAVVSEEPPPTCRPDSCLNGGKCVPERSQQLKCICPTHTYGPRCKILHREFNSHRLPIKSDTLGSWAWLPSLPTCSHLHLTLHIITRNMNGLILYASDPSVVSYNPFLALQIARGRPQLILRHGSPGSTFTVTLNNTVNDHKWHRIDLHWRNQVSDIRQRIITYYS